MDKKMYYILGTIFIITSGIIYTFERFTSQYSLPGQSTSFSQNSNSVTSYLIPLQSPFSNLFIPVFIVIGVIFFVRGYSKK